jgi:hypothetical protein
MVKFFVWRSAPHAGCYDFLLDVCAGIAMLLLQDVCVVLLLRSATSNPLCLLLLLQDVCVVLELRDATLLVPNLRKMAAVLAAIPKLEAFVAQVCQRFICYNAK